MHLESFAKTHVGRRANNEDAFLASADLGLFAVADGLGGHEGGEVASRIAVTALREVLGNRVRSSRWLTPFAASTASTGLVRAAITMANARVIAGRHQHPQMGTTLAALAMVDDRAVIANVGDSRVYRLREGRLTQLTRDHSACAERARRGLRPACSHASDSCNVVTRSLGQPRVTPDVHAEAVVAGDAYVLCTDGLVEAVSDHDIRRLLENLPPESACEMMVDLAYDRGGRDNITVVVVSVCDD